MKTVKAWAIVSADGDIETAANNPRVFFNRSDAADEAWKFRTGSHVEQVEIAAIAAVSYLLEACRKAHLALQIGHNDYTDYGITAAIAKAEGRDDSK